MATPALENRTGIVGQPLDRIDGRAKVTGTATYAAEYQIERLAHGYVVHSTIAAGRIVDIETAAAEHAPGVLAVLTHLNAHQQLPQQRRGGDSGARAVLHGPRIEYFGQPIALVIAESLEGARCAAGLVVARYEPDAPALDFDLHLHEAYRPQQVEGEGEGSKPDTKRGDFDRAFAAAPVKIDATYTTPYEHNNPMEPHATIAVWARDKLTLYDAAQSPHDRRDEVARTFGLDPAHVRIITPYIGGAFGSKFDTHNHVILAAMGARRIGRPVKVALARQQMFSMTTHRAHTRQRVAIGARPDGTITAIAHDSCLQTAIAQEFIEQSSVISRMMYAGPNRRTTHRAVKLNLPVPGIMRAPGEAPGSFALESAMDEIAAALGMDPIELRIKNEPEYDPEKRVPFSSRNLIECLRIGAVNFGWAQRGPIRSLHDGRWRVGIGVAGATYPTRIGECGARIRLTPNGRAQVKLAATDLGTGTFTILAQIAAETLGLPIDAVEVEIGDTEFPRTPGSGGSWMAASAGSAVYQAALAVNRKRRNGSTGAVEAEIKTKPGDAAKKFSMHAFGAHFVEIGIDGTTGELRLRRMLGVYAAGRILNAKTARSQLLGGMVMGVGMALGEESIVDPRYGHFVNADLAEYHIPVHADIPDSFDAIFIDEKDDKVNPLGAKGLGELGIVGAAAAVANAVYHATGQRIRNLPITLDKVLPA